MSASSDDLTRLVPALSFDMEHARLAVNLIDEPQRIDAVDDQPHLRVPSRETRRLRRTCGSGIGRAVLIPAPLAAVARGAWDSARIDVVEIRARHALDSRGVVEV